MPRARLVDVAARAGVSPATVSLVLRDRPGPSAAARAAVLAAAADLDYRVDRTASRLASHRSRLVGVALDVRSPFHAELAVALEEAAAATGVDVVLATLTPSRTEADVVATLLDGRCEGLILLGSSRGARAIADVAAVVPAVVVGRRGVGDAIGVRADDAVGMAAAVDHLVGLGHRRLVHVEGPRGAIGAARRRGFLAAVARHHVDGVGGGDAVDGVGRVGRVGGVGGVVVPGGDDEAAGLEAAAYLPAEATGVVTFNDRVAVGVREGLARLGRSVPHDVTLVGYDDSPLARLATQDLTSVSQDPPALAAAAIGALEARLGDAGSTVDGAWRDVVVRPRLVVRSSTMPPP